MNNGFDDEPLIWTNNPSDEQPVILNNCSNPKSFKYKTELWNIIESSGLNGNNMDNYTGVDFDPTTLSAHTIFRPTKG